MNRRILLIALALVLAVACMAGCSKKKDSAAATPEGSWKAQSMTASGMTVTMEDGGAIAIDLVMSSGGKFTMTMTESGQSESVEGTWTFKDGKGEMTVDGEAVPYTLEGDKLTMAQDGNNVIFVRK